MRSAYRGGFSMMETLVSVLVLSAGVIGAAGMQLTALRTSQQSGYQTIATQLATELADRMRANDVQMRQDDTSNPYLGVDFQTTSEEAAAPSKLCYSASCDAAELAAFDLYEWKMRLKSVLPFGRAVVCRDSKPWDGTKQALSWNCNPDAGDGGVYVIKIGWQAKNPDGSLIRDDGNAFSPSVALAVEPYVR